MSTASHSHAGHHAPQAPPAGAARFQKKRAIAITTPLGPDALLLRGATIHEELGQCFSIDADLCSRSTSLPFDQLVGGPMSIRLQREDGNTRHWHGICAALDQVGEQGDLALYRATIVPTMWRLSRRFDCRIFQHKRVPQIVLEVLKQHGIVNVESTLTEKYPEREFIVQYRESDLNFIQRLMEFEGIYFFFEHDADSCRIVLADSPTAHRPIPGYETVKYRPNTDVSAAEAVSEWIIASTLSTGRIALDDFDFAAPSKHLLAKTAAHGDRPGADLEAFDYPGAYTDLSDGERYARIRLQHFEARRCITRARADARGLACGATFTLADHPRPDQKRRWLITQATHILRSDEFETARHPSHIDLPVYDCALHALDAATHFRPDRRAPKPFIAGPQTAIVVGAKGEEIHTDNHGRVRVRFHWDRYATGDDHSSCFIRSNQSWAGKGWGGIQIPRVGQEVIVEFLEGDPDRPLITGRLYNADSMPPVSAAGRSEKKGETNPANMVEAAMQMTLRSSSLGGSGGHNEITMHDAGGAEKLFLRAQKDEVHLVQNDRDDTVLRNVNRLIGQDETKSIARNKMQLVGGNADETIGGSHFVTIGDNFQMNVSGNFSSAVGGTQDESTVGKRSISVQDAMAITVKEGRVDNARFYEMVAQSTLYLVGSFLGFHKLSPAKPSEGEAAPPPGAMEKTAWIEIGEDSAITIANEKASIVIDKDGVIHLNGKKILLNC